MIYFKKFGLSSFDKLHYFIENAFPGDMDKGRGVSMFIVFRGNEELA